MELDPNIKPAATLVLLRPAGAPGGAFEVLLMRRHGQSGFMGGVHVFPGGKVDPSDCDERYLGRCAPFDWNAAAERFREPVAFVRGHYIALLRETFEEAGTLLASKAGDAAGLLALDAPEARERFDAYRKQLNAAHEAAAFFDMLQAEDLRLRPDLVVYFDHWITPEMEKRRFNTRFFAAVAPASQSPTCDDREMTEWRWITPEAAIRAFESEEIRLAPPTFVTLLRMAGKARPGEVLEGLARRAVETNQPRPKALGGKMALLLPGHPEYGEQIGKAVTLTGDTPVAMTLEAGGRWRVVES